MDNEAKIIALLEDIAYYITPRFVEKPEYLEALYASRKSETTEVHGDVRSQPETREGQVSESQGLGGVQPQARRRVREKEPQVDHGWVKHYKGGRDT